MTIRISQHVAIARTLLPGLTESLVPTSRPLHTIHFSRGVLELGPSSRAHSLSRATSGCNVPPSAHYWQFDYLHPYMRPHLYRMDLALARHKNSQVCQLLLRPLRNVPPRTHCAHTLTPRHPYLTVCAKYLLSQHALPHIILIRSLSRASRSLPQAISGDFFPLRFSMACLNLDTLHPYSNRHTLSHFVIAT